MDVEYKNSDSSPGNGKLDWGKLLSSPPKLGSRGLWTYHQDNLFTLSFTYSSNIHTPPLQDKDLRQHSTWSLAKWRFMCTFWLLINPTGKDHEISFFEIMNTRPWYVIKLGQNWSETCKTVGRAGYQQMNVVGERLSSLDPPLLFIAVSSTLQSFLSSN